jgi:hypothetical protein
MTSNTEMNSHSKLSATFLEGKDRSCEGKVRHPDEASAKEAAVIRSNRKLRLEAYECPFCGGWHIGRKQPSS